MKKKIIIGGVIALVAVTALIIKIAGGGEDMVIQSTDTAAPALVTSTLRQTGVIKPQVGAMISVGARATGKLEMVKVKVGDKVTEGELVAKIDSRAIVQSIKQSQDQLNKALVDLDTTKKLYPVQVAMQENTVESSKSSHEYLQGVYEREQVLYDKGYSRKETLDKTKHDMTSAFTEYERQKLQLEFMKTEYNAKVATSTAEINRLRSVLEEQQIQLSYTEIYSPITGVVSAVNSVEGETIVAGLEVAKLITVFRPELLEMFVYVDESDVGKVTEGMEVKYTVDTYQGKEFTGSISRINLQSETKDGVVYYVAIVDISEEDALLLRPEMTTNVRIIAKEEQKAVTVPNAAIKWEQGNQLVYKVIDKNKNVTEKITVKVGLRGESRSEILEGIEAGDEVVVRFGSQTAAMEPGRRP